MPKFKDKIVIIGAGGHAREALDIIEALQEDGDSLECIGFIVDEKYGKPGTIVNGLPILGDIDWLIRKRNEVSVVCAIGDAHLRFRMIKRFEGIDILFRTLLHPKAVIANRTEIGLGCIVQAGCVISNNVIISNHVHINLNCSISHDVSLNDFVQISPGCHISGWVKIDKGCFLGTGANIIDRITLGEWSQIGAGSTIIKHVEPNTTVVGVPGKVVKQLEKGWHLKDA